MLKLPAVIVVLVGSGVTSLVYQIIWQRLLVFSVGTDTHSVALIVAGFMAGLGLGSLAGGHLADRLGERGRLWLIACCEVAIGLFAAGSVTLYYDVLYAAVGSTSLSWAGIAAFSIAATVVPTFFMGMTLPLAVRVVTRPDDPPHRWPAVLYGFNTMGAAAGAVLTVELLIPYWGLEGALMAGAVINLACAATAAGLALRVPQGPPATAPSSPPTPVVGRSGLAHPAWLAAFVLSGFTAMVLEIVWFRVLGVMLHSRSATFAYLLFLYLGGLGLGALAASSATARRWPAARSFQLMQSLIPVCAVLMLSALVMAAERLVASGAAERMMVPRSAAGLAAAIGLIGVPTFLMGLSFGSLQRVVQDDLATLGRRVGWFQLASISGGTAGALAGGFLLLGWLGTAGTLRLLVAIGMVFAWPLVRHRRSQMAAAAAAGIFAAWMVPDQQRLWSSLQATDSLITVVEEASGLVSLNRLDDSHVAILINGQPQSEFPYDGIHVTLGALPVMLHPNPVRVAVIGLGSGSTAFAAGGRMVTERIDIIEIVEPVRTALAALLLHGPFPGLRQLLADGRVRHHLADGRAFLQRTTRRYDVIQADALLPQNAFAGNLYSREYFELVRRRLKPGGFGVTWAPTERVVDSMRAAFPYVTVLGEIAIGSDRPVPIDGGGLARHGSDPRKRHYYGSAGIELDQVLDEALLADRMTFSGGLDLLGEQNEDLFPRDEFDPQ